MTKPNTITITTEVTLSDDFLRDVLITAVEGGIGYWCSLSEYRHSAEDPYCIVDEVYEADEDEYATLPCRVATGDIARGIALIVGRETSLSPHGVGVVVNALMQDDAGELDADSADWIFQAALLGDVIFG